MKHIPFIKGEPLPQHLSLKSSKFASCHHLSFLMLSSVNVKINELNKKVIDIAKCNMI